ncbi:MAG: hypothetical protein L0241_04470 [Planctomycetia bacterium]|nr:hypothetical protein [Planctomycetia bacterium]
MPQILGFDALQGVTSTRFLPILALETGPFCSSPERIRKGTALASPHFSCFQRAGEAEGNA